MSSIWCFLTFSDLREVGYQFLLIIICIVSNNDVQGGVFMHYSIKYTGIENYITNKTNLINKHFVTSGAS